MLPRTLAVCLIAVALPGVALGQQKPVELGVDAGFEVNFNGGTATSLSVPLAVIRAGFFVSDQISIEPSVGFLYIKVEDVDALYTLDAGLAGLYHFHADASRTRPYVRAQGGLALLGGGGDTATQFTVAGGVGVKIPVVNQLAVRLEAVVARGFENDDFAGSTAVAGLIGFSVFTR